MAFIYAGISISYTRMHMCTTTTWHRWIEYKLMRLFCVDFLSINFVRLLAKLTHSLPKMNEQKGQPMKTDHDFYKSSLQSFWNISIVIDFELFRFDHNNIFLPFVTKSKTFECTKKLWLFHSTGKDFQQKLHGKCDTQCNHKYSDFVVEKCQTENDISLSHMIFSFNCVLASFDNGGCFVCAWAPWQIYRRKMPVDRMKNKDPKSFIDIGKSNVREMAFLTTPVTLI